ncbi:hypothetical protein AtubIFM55763_006066 [Aspergillus tubingensis]|nr:hypothetical protein AtubIFM55763_006066 [Aspergillus tubingensis]GLA99308.1 hypothetical protein AtubIFM57143_007615 [Aspergillus tubingensis]GLB23031.1 hypothetical protein AtubIFM61612_003615 [Aspergillus tubingensis]
MMLSTVWVLAAIGLASTSETPASDAVTSLDPGLFSGGCTPEKMSIRKEWRNMTKVEQKSYLKGVNCLMDLPAQTGLEATTNRFSDLQALHRALTDTPVGDIIHSVAYDTDSGNLFRSEMWDADAFGGNGTEPDGCVTDGAFAYYTEHIGPQEQNTVFCMNRSWGNYEAILNTTGAAVAHCNTFDSYDEYFACIAATPHRGGHWAVGGVMEDVKTSPGDPLFYLHHGYIDRLWYRWQMHDPAKRLWDMGGPAINESANVEPASGWPQTTLNYTLTTFDIMPDVTVADVMNPVGGYLCYNYEA